MYDNSEKKERVFLAAVSGSAGEEAALRSLEELKSLAKTAGCEVVSTVLQNREDIHPGTYLGKGKIEEIKAAMNMLEADTLICDDELSPAQINNLQEELSVKVCDRTLLILDIFAMRALTREGKIQVELAQLRYRASRLTGLGKSLSRLGGGIGTRGPGEQKLEIDRRRIGERISTLKRSLEEVKSHRELLRAGRKKENIPVAAIVGYTNAGKSTLLNTLTGAGVLEEDALFATLDPTTRLVNLPEGSQVLLTDTVGFIRKLPHHLIEAFRSTLEETLYADIIINVVDASDPDREEQMQVVYETLDMLGVKGKPVITLFNKMDKKTDDGLLFDKRADKVLKISAKRGDGLRELLECIPDVLMTGKLYIERLYPFDQAGKVALIRKYGRLIGEKYTNEGIEVKAYIPMEIYGSVD